LFALVVACLAEFVDVALLADRVIGAPVSAVAHGIRRLIAGERFGVIARFGGALSTEASFVGVVAIGSAADQAGAVRVAGSGHGAQASVFPGFAALRQTNRFS
jgi:hypothetical protein